MFHLNVIPNGTRDFVIGNASLNGSITAGVDTDAELVLHNPGNVATDIVDNPAGGSVGLVVAGAISLGAPETAQNTWNVADRLSCTMTVPNNPFV